MTERSSEEVLTEYLETKSGDLLSVLYERMQRKLCSLALRILRSPDDAEDVVQGVFCKLTEVEPQPIRSAESFLFRMVQNAAIGLLCRNGSDAQDGAVSLETFEPTEWCEHDLEYQGKMPKYRDVADPRSLPPKPQAQKKELPEEVRAAISDLPEEQREAVQLHFGRDFTVAETAEMLGRDEATAEMLIHRGMIALRGVLVLKEVQPHPLAKPIRAIDPDTGAVAHEFANVDDAFRASGGSKRYLRNALKEGVSYRGYLWSYATAV